MPTTQIDVGFLAYPNAVGKQNRSIVKTVAASATPEKLTATSILTNKVTIYGAKALAGTPNAASVFVGDATTQIQQLVPYDPTLAGGEVVIQAPQGGYIDLSEIYIRVGTNGDGVVASYLAN